MALFVLDTDTLTHYRSGHPQICARVRACAPADLAATIISAEEQLTGWYTLLRQARQPAQVERAYARLAETIQFYAGLQVLPFTLTSITRYQQLLPLRLNIGRMDLRIAAIVLENAATLVTRNLRDFQRVPGLTIEDWSV
jgi:tRNA(fMet)-specific endonuclease VapC